MMVNDKMKAFSFAFLFPFCHFFSRMSVFEVLNFGLAFTCHLLIIPYYLLIITYCLLSFNCSCLLFSAKLFISLGAQNDQQLIQNT
jgi:hypothetical protein